ncbi:hypothetical protein [Aureibaculum luteum]|uniref:hypothetical protein n=1 Tax=Aureibaculum luteum TaxID=1548456 RepID=UPI000E498480|nr:hypothetical protein [Aureibaculum luteum]
MKVTRINLLIVWIALLTLSCNKKENKSEESTRLNSEKVVAINSPYELISREDVKNIFNVVEFPIDVQDKVLTQPTCIYKWEDSKVFRMKKIVNQEVKFAMPSEVLIVMVKKCTESMFKRSTSVYKQPHLIENLGDMAVWDVRMSQMTFLSNHFIFHVHVKVSNENQINLKKATEVSNLIIEKLSAF